MSKEIEDRLDRLEKIVGAAGYDIHEFDSTAQAKAHAAQLEADQKAEEKLQAKNAQADITVDIGVGVTEAVAKKSRAAAKPSRKSSRSRPTTSGVTTKKQTAPRGTRADIAKQTSPGTPSDASVPAVDPQETVKKGTTRSGR